MASKRKFYWYKAQLLFAAVLQFLAVFAPLSYAGNWGAHRTAFLHPFWITSETNDFVARTSTTDLIWFFLRFELIFLVVWMVGLGILVTWVIFSKTDWANRVDRLGKAMGGFAAQIVLAYLIAQSVVWHVGEESPGEEIEFRLLPQFFLLLFPLIFSYMAWKRMKRIESGTKDEESGSD